MFGLFGLFVVANGLDAYLTHQIVRRGGVELNPIVQWFLNRWGVYGLILHKWLFVSSVGLLIYIRLISVFELMVIVIFYFWFVLVMVYELKKLFNAGKR